jgi:hypothetical protein
MSSRRADDKGFSMRPRLAGLVVLLALAVACTRSAPADVLLSPVPPFHTPPGPPPSPILQMPSVVGMAFGDARDVLKARGFTVKRNDRYLSNVTPERVLNQSPKVGSIVDFGATIKLTVVTAFPAPVNGNPWGYNWACCKKILTPPTDFCTFFACVTTFNNGTGYVVQCQDDLFSATGGSKQACSGHNGRKRTLLSP